MTLSEEEITYQKMNLSINASKDKINQLAILNQLGTPSNIGNQSISFNYVPADGTQDQILITDINNRDDDPFIDS